MCLVTSHLPPRKTKHLLFLHPQKEFVLVRVSLWRAKNPTLRLLAARIVKTLRRSSDLCSSCKLTSETCSLISDRGCLQLFTATLCVWNIWSIHTDTLIKLIHEKLDYFFMLTKYFMLKLKLIFFREIICLVWRLHRKYIVNTVLISVYRCLCRCAWNADSWTCCSNNHDVWKDVKTYISWSIYHLLPETWLFKMVLHNIPALHNPDTWA